ncbi:Hypothetical protein, putative [Bodo saltans]|uniref:Uncharacterized protein n=1 Tax=Bodo saltans TaxID=75058 RepID=A0A0S4IVM3_BODSA|nr:Hypothetical protein, putative [Bodo saltans]|eukprot:CUG01131.1 Hypothetical protein, putative [Bodo saltans]
MSRSLSTQTAVNTVTSAGVQTKPTSRLSYVLPSSGGVAEGLLLQPRTDTESVLALVGEDIVVDYADDDSNAPEYRTQRLGSDQRSSEEEGDVGDHTTEATELVSFGHGRVVSLPKRRQSRNDSISSASPIARRMSPSPERSSVVTDASPRVVVVPSNVDADEAARRIIRLEQDLDQLRVASTLREKELNSIVENCRTAIRGELEREWNRKETAFLKTIEGLERTAQQLKDVLVKRDETIRDKAALLRQQDELIDEAKRQRDRHWMVVEGQLKSEVARLQRDKEKMRFDVEVASNHSSAFASAVTTVEARAATAERMWEDKRLRREVIAEDTARQFLEEHALSLLDAIRSASAQVQRLDDYHTIRSEERWERIHSMLEPALRYNGQEGLDALLAAAPRRPSTDPLVDQDLVTSIAEVTIHDLIHSRAVEWRELQAAQEQDAAARDQQVARLSASVDVHREQLVDLQAAYDERLNQMTQRCSTAEAVLATAAAKISSGASRRAKDKATGDVLDELVREHEVALGSVSAELRETRLELEDVKRRNMVEEALALRGKLTTVEADRTGLARTAATLQAQLRTLEATSREMSGGVVESQGRVQELTGELERVRHQLTTTEEKSRETIIQLRKRNDELETDANRCRLQLQSARDDQQLLQRRNDTLVQQNASLKEKFVADKTEEVVARVNRKLSQVDISHVPTASHQDVERLQQKVLMLRKENDALAHRLDSALAEASHAEEQRQHALQRTLGMMAMDDAAPKREQLLMAQKSELDTYAKQLAAKEEFLAHRALEIERRESHVGRHAAASAHGPLGIVSSIVQQQQTSSAEGSESGSARREAARKGAAVRLAPISLRPVASSTPSDRSDANPQKYVPHKK